LARADARGGLRSLVEAEHRDDREAGDSLDALDRVDELLEIVEGLDDEEVGAAAFEDRRLLAEELAPDARARGFAERPDRAGDEDVPPSGLARATRELHGLRVDSLELVLEEVVRELAPVRGERVRLDELGAGVHEA